MLADAILNALSVLVRWIPIRAEIIYEYHQGVRYWKGKAVRLLKTPGIYFYIAWIGDITKEVVKPKEIELPIQCITTSEGKARSFSIGCQYETANLLLQQTMVDDFEKTLSNLIARVAAMVMRNSGDLEPDKEILRKVRTQAEKWGVRILYLGLLNDAQSRPLHHFGDGLIKTESDD